MVPGEDNRDRALHRQWTGYLHSADAHLAGLAAIRRGATHVVLEQRCCVDGAISGPRREAFSGRQFGTS